MLYKDEWLSQYFEHGAYRYDSPFDIHDFPKGFVYVKVPAENVKALNRVVQQGFKAVEILVQFEQKKTIPYEKQDKVHIEFSTPEDRGAVATIAEKAFMFSRFYQDEEIPTTTADQIKADWVSNYFKGQRGDKMVVAREEGHVVGFLLLIERSIDLIAVSSTHTGKGIASAMIKYASQKVGPLKAGTQLTNKPSIALYEKSGFVLKQAYYVLHRHIL